MSQLKLVKPDEVPATLNTLLYGPAKVGKTVGATSAPAPVLLLNADRPARSRFAHQLHGDKLREVRIDDTNAMQVLVDVVHHLKDPQAEEKSVVLDSINELHRALIEQASNRAIRPTLNQYGDVSVHIERFCRALCDLDINAVFVAHETSVKDEDAGHFERLPFTGTSNPALGAKVMAMVDVIGYCGVVLGEDPEAEPRHVAQLINANGRRGGDGTGRLGKSRDLDLTEWVETAAVGPPKGETKTTTGKRAA